MAMKKPRDVTLALTHSICLPLPHAFPLPPSLTLTPSHTHTHTLSLAWQEKIMAMKKPRDVTCVDAKNLIVEHLEVRGHTV